MQKMQKVKKNFDKHAGKTTLSCASLFFIRIMLFSARLDDS